MEVTKMSKVLIDGVEYVPKKESIEELHKRQKAFIDKNNLSVGDIILVINDKRAYNHLQVTSIHNMYGWINADTLSSKGVSYGTAYNIDPKNIKSIYKRKEGIMEVEQ
jgi:hypothetical protein